MGKGPNLTTVWDSYKTVIRDYLIQYDTWIEKKSAGKIQNVLDEIKVKGKKNQKSLEDQNIFNQLKLLQQQISMLTISHMKKKLKYTKQIF